MTKNYYSVLEVVDDAEDIVIRAAYKALAQKYHPDKWSGDPQEANVIMNEVNEAYRILSDPVLKNAYDERTEASRDQQRFGFHQANPSNQANPSDHRFKASVLKSRFDRRVTWLLVGVVVLIFVAYSNVFRVVGRIADTISAAWKPKIIFKNAYLGKPIDELQFQIGKLSKKPSDDFAHEKNGDFPRFIYKSGIENQLNAGDTQYAVEDNKIISISYLCHSPDIANIAHVTCGDTADQIKSLFHARELIIECFERADSVEWRNYTIQNKGLNFILHKNKVAYINYYDPEKYMFAGASGMVTCH